MGCGLTSSKGHYTDYKRQPSSLLSGNELHTLELLFSDFADRNIYGNMDQESFELLFKKSGLWGEHIFKQFDLNNSSFLTKGQFLVGVATFYTTNTKQKAKLLFQHFTWGQEPPPQPGLTYNNFVKMLYNYPRKDLKNILQDQHFFEQKVRSHILEYKGTSPLSEQADDNIPIDAYLEEKETESFDSHSMDSCAENTGSSQSLELRTKNCLGFEICGKKINLKISSLHETVRMFVEMVYSDLKIDPTSRILTEDQFYSWLAKNKTILESYFGGFHQEIWTEKQGLPAYLFEQPKKESKIKLISGKDKPKKLQVLYIKDMLLFHEVETREKLYKIICLNGLSFTYICQKQYGWGIKISHQNGVYSEKKIFFKTEEEAKQWFQTLRVYNCGNLQAEYKIMGVLAQGRYSTVYECEQIQTKRIFALKETATYKLAEEEKTILMRQSKILSILDHHSIPQLQSCFKNKTHQYIVMEKGKGVQLNKYVKEKERLIEIQAKRITRQIIYGVRSFHKMGIVHRDLKPHNILLSNPQQPSKPQIKIVDFGFADYIHRINQSTHVRGGLAIGSPHYMAPEVLSGQEISEKCDNFSIGSIVYFLLSGMLPFLAETYEDIIEKTKQGAFNFCHKIWKAISNQAKDFIERLLDPEPKRRMDLKSALQHEWMREKARSNHHHHTPLTPVPVKKRTLRSLVF